jgi:hypothetical protein
MAFKTRSSFRYAPYFRAGARFAGAVARKYAINKSASYLASLSKRRSVAETGVTSQYDKVTQYSKKRMPRRKRVAWKKFVNKVQAVNSKSLGTRTVVFNDTIITSAPTTAQGFCAATLYGFCGVEDGRNSGFRDIYRICNRDNDIMTSGSDGGNASKIVFGSGVIDFTMRNTSLNAMEVDLYEINVNTDSTKEPNFLQSEVEAAALTLPIPGGAGGIGLAQRGVTIFDIPNLISQDKLKIYKKKKFFLPPGNTATHQHRDPRNHYFNATDININDQGNQSSYARRKMTQMFVFVTKSVVGATGDHQLDVGVTRKYTYYINQSAKALDSYNP